jgi:hypothetical protein
MFFGPWRGSTESLPNPSRSSEQFKFVCCYPIRKRVTELDRHGLPIWLGRINDFVTAPGDPHFITLGGCDAHASSCLTAKWGSAAVVMMLAWSTCEPPNGYGVTVSRVSNLPLCCALGPPACAAQYSCRREPCTGRSAWLPLDRACLST